jgi:hypothetical protein
MRANKPGFRFAQSEPRAAQEFAVVRITRGPNRASPSLPPGEAARSRCTKVAPVHRDLRFWAVVSDE